MNKAKVQKGIKNLTTIREIIEISKFDTLNKLQSATKISESYLDMALVARQLVIFAKNTYRVKEKTIKVNGSKRLWIYVTPDSELMSISNSRFEEMIEDKFDKGKDIMIAVGSSAVKFANKHNFNCQFSSVKSTGQEEMVSETISSSINGGEISEVKFIINSPKIKDEPLIIYPLNKLNIKLKKKSSKINSKYKFYPSISESIHSLTHIYLERLVFALMKESQFLHLKEKLIRHESSIKSVDDKIDEKKNQINKLGRKEETEELILVSQIAKRGGKNE